MQIEFSPLFLYWRAIDIPLPPETLPKFWLFCAIDTHWVTTKNEIISSPFLQPLCWV